MTNQLVVRIDGRGDLNREELIKEVDKDLELFDKWFTDSFEGSQPLAKFERAIIKTYLMWKLDQEDGRLVGEQTEATAQPVG